MLVEPVKEAWLAADGRKTTAARCAPFARIRYSSR